MTRITGTLIIAMVIMVGARSSGAQTTSDDLRIALRATAQFTEADIAALDSGELVVKVLKSKEKRQIGVCGIVRLQQVPQLSMAVFRESLTQRSNKSVLASGKFSIPPLPENVRSLRLDKSDFDDLKTCEPGNCKLKLPNDMIRQLRSEIDAETAETQSRVTQLFGNFLIAYISDYAARGNKALIQYDNEKVPVRLADEHRLLLDESPLIHGLAPEFATYLAGFPDIALRGTESSLDWTKVTFGFKPFVTVTHSISYDRGDLTGPRFLIATRQIYASRYVDSSLALSMFVSTTAEAGLIENYLVFTDVSRSDALGGALSGIKRSVVGGEATARVKELLQQSKKDLEAGPRHLRASEPDHEPSGFIGSIRSRFGDPLTFTLLAVIVGTILIVAYRKIRSGRA